MMNFSVFPLTAYARVKSRTSQVSHLYFREFFPRKYHFVSFVDEGEYICPRCTLFGLEKPEVQTLIEAGFKMTDHNKEEEGYEVQNSVFKVRCTYYMSR
jgi:hypothetical protein